MLSIHAIDKLHQATARCLNSDCHSLQTILSNFTMGQTSLPLTLYCGIASYVYEHGFSRAIERITSYCIFMHAAAADTSAPLMLDMHQITKHFAGWGEEYVPPPAWVS